MLLQHKSKHRAIQTSDQISNYTHSEPGDFTFQATPFGSPPIRPPQYNALDASSGWRNDSNKPTMATMKTGVRKWVMRVISAGGALLVSLALLNTLLETKAAFIPLGIQNYAFSRYDFLPGGLYFLEPVSRVNFMWPLLDIEAFWNGYTWRHRGDRRGFRNPPGTQRGDNLLLGDSIIYGHGVDFEESIAGVLRNRYGYSVYNLSRQGACLYDNYIFLRLYLKELAPERVILFVFGNDVADLKFYRSPSEIEHRPEINTYDYQLIRKNVENLGSHPPSPLLCGMISEPAVRILRRSLSDLKNSALTALKHDDTSGAKQTFIFDQNATAFPRGILACSLLDLPSPISPTRTTAQASLQEDRATFPRSPSGTQFSDPPTLPPSTALPRQIHDYYDAILGDISERCRQLGAQTEVVYLILGGDRDPSIHGETTGEFDRLLRTVSDRHGISYVNTRHLFDDCPECFLPHDGHLSPAGHRRIAKFLAETSSPAWPPGQPRSLLAVPSPTHP